MKTFGLKPRQLANLLGNSSMNISFLLKNPGNEPVKPVADSGNNKCYQGKIVFAFQQEYYQYRDQQYANKGYGIGDVHLLGTLPFS